jgi:carbon storage regulator
MLKLSRKLNESIEIGDGIFIHVTEIRGDRVQLSFDAPRDVLIRRTEIPPRHQRPKTGKDPAL